MDDIKIRYLVEIRRRCIYTLVWFGINFAVVFYFVDYLFTLIITPLLHVLPNYKTLLATSVTGPIFAQLKLTFVFAIFFSIPYFLYQVWKFMYPALSQTEIRNFKSIIISSGSLFVAGVTLCYFVVLPLLFKFFIAIVPAQVTLMPDINYTIDFILRMLLVFGCCFQLPLLMIMCAKFNFISAATMRYYRPHFIVFAFIIGMILTPPDVFSQIMLALPMVILYEFGLFLSRRIA